MKNSGKMTETNLKDHSYSPISFLYYTFHPKKGSIISKEGREIFMEPRLKDFFHILLLNKDDVVSREELMEFVWKDTVVTEDSISKAASDLRKFLTKNNINGVVLTTITKMGYQLKLLQITPPLKNQVFSQRKLFRVAAYGFGFILMLIIIIRALRYEQ